jgi:hypothetical protein
MTAIFQSIGEGMMLAKAELGRCDLVYSFDAIDFGSRTTADSRSHLPRRAEGKKIEAVREKVQFKTDKKDHAR